MARDFLTQVGEPLIEESFNGLRTITRIFDVNAGGMATDTIEDNVLLAYGTADVEHTTALLVRRQLDQSTIEKSGYELRLVEVYQGFTAGQKVSVGEDQVTLLSDGRTQLVRRYVCLSSEAEGLAAAIGDVLGGRACANVVIADQGVGAEITETYISAGKLNEDTSEQSNGKLIIKTLTYFNEIPPTPFGYVIVDQSVRDTEGVQTYVYRFAKGLGEVSRSTALNSNGALEVVQITHLTAPGASDPLTALSGYVRTSISKQEQEGHLLWRATFAKGAGEVSRDTSTGANGALETVRITHLTAPGASLPFTTPDTGYVLTDYDKQESDGHLVWRATYARGNGEIGRTTSHQNNGKLERITVRHLSYSTVSSSPISVPSDYTTVDGPDFQEADGHRIWTASFAKGDGEVSRSTSYNQSDDSGDTGISVVRVAHLTSPSVSSSPISTPIGFVLVSDEMDERDGHRVWQATFAKGTGVVSENISPRQDGLREVTWVSLGSREVPPGIIIRDDWKLADGYKVYAVGAIQAADGGTVLSAISLTFERYVPFTYPGRAKAFTETYGGKTMLAVFKSPPVTTGVLATITVTYQTSDEIGTISPSFWNPREWATMRAQWQSFDGEPTNIVQPLMGYRSMSSTAVTVTASTSAPSDASAFGQLVYGGTTARVIITGGPANPGGQSLTLDLTIEPAFTATNGTVYYRRTQVSATIPAQDDLPV